MLLNNYLTHARAIHMWGFYCIVLNLIEIFTIVKKIFNTDDLILFVSRLRTQNILVFQNVCPIYYIKALKLYRLWYVFEEASRYLKTQT